MVEIFFLKICQAILSVSVIEKGWYIYVL